MIRVWEELLTVKYCTDFTKLQRKQSGLSNQGLFPLSKGKWLLVWVFRIFERSRDGEIRIPWLLFSFHTAGLWYMGWYWPSMRSRWLDIINGQVFFVCVYGPRWSRDLSCHKKNKQTTTTTKKTTMKPIFAILDEQAWSIKDLLYVNINSNNNNKFVGKSRVDKIDPSCQSQCQVYHLILYGHRPAVLHVYKWDCRRNQTHPKIQGYQNKIAIKYETERIINKKNFFEKKWIFTPQII